MFTFVFYTGEMAYAISSIMNAAPNTRSIKQVMLTMIYHAAKIIYRAATLMIVNNFLYDICRPVCRYLSSGSYQYKYYYHTRLGIPIPPRRVSMAAVNAFPIQTNPNYSYYSTYPQPQSKLVPNDSRPQPHVSPRPPPAPHLAMRPPYHHYRPYTNCVSNGNRKFYNQERVPLQPQWHQVQVFEWLV